MPLVGTWIEIPLSKATPYAITSCPSWARGLKWISGWVDVDDAVVPLVGTWIEIAGPAQITPHACRAPRGHVD